MALKKNVELESGVKAEYWRIVYTEIDWAAKKARIGIQLWLDEENRRAGKSPVEAAPRYILIEHDGVGDWIFGGVREAVLARGYDVAKLVEDLDGATDVLEQESRTPEV